MKHTIQGGNLPVALITLEAGESLITEKGGMSWMTPNMEMDTSMKGGFLKGIGRAATGESVFLNTYTNKSNNPGLMACASSFPGEIFAKQLAEGEELIAQKGAFLCAESSVAVSVHIRKKLGVGFFGGEGFIMQKFTGPGWVFLEIDGAALKYTLEAGQKLVIDPGHLAVQTPSISTEITMVKGLKNIALGGEGLLLATVTGPGDVWLQTITIPNVAKIIHKYFPASGASGGLNINI